MSVAAGLHTVRPVRATIRCCVRSVPQCACKLYLYSTSERERAPTATDREGRERYMSTPTCRTVARAALKIPPPTDACSQSQGGRHFSICS